MSATARSPLRNLPALGLLAFLPATVVTPAAGSGQVPEDLREPPIVAGVVFDSTAAAPLVGAAVYVFGTSLLTTTDSLGRFALLNVPAGPQTLSIRHPRLDSLGLSGPPEWQVQVEGELTRVRLSIPSLVTLMGDLCAAPGGGPDNGMVIGTVRDASTGTALPEATVVFTAQAFDREVETDRQGRFTACGLPTGRPLLAHASFLGHSPQEAWVRPANGEPAFHAFELPVAEGVPVAGRVVDHQSGRAVDNAGIRIESGDGDVMATVTDHEGRFDLGHLNLETYLIQVHHLAYGTQTRWFTISDVEPVSLELELAPTALEVEGLTVTVTYPAMERRQRAGVRPDLVTREEIEELLGSAQDVGDLVRDIPGVSVSRGMSPGTGQSRLCVEDRRDQNPGCHPALVVVDGVPANPEILEMMPPQTIESIEFVPAIMAGIRWGARSGGGVLVITTRQGGGGR